VQQDPTSLRNQLVEEIKKAVQDETILNAFWAVPRHEFIETFFSRAMTPNKKQAWQAVHPFDPEWLTEIYTNRPLTTSIDKNGNPNISSSQPDIMAKMIRSVHLQPGHRVLEIGTGTGYNAAILAHIVGKENVVSIDINLHLLDRAQERIGRTVGVGVTLLNADGRNLPETLRHFDAIIVTGSHEQFEPSWIKALESGGRIVFNWNKSFTKAMLEAEKTNDGKLSGRVCDYRGDFMHLHDGNGVEWPSLPPQPLERIISLKFQHTLLEVDFGFFLQIHLPHLTLHRYRKKGERYYAVKERNRVVQFFSSEIKGDVSLWEEIQAIHAQFQKMKEPNPQMFSLITDENGTMSFIYKEH
jgi:protein-L-isoaspartate O-methyltransferase